MKKITATLAALGLAAAGLVVTAAPAQAYRTSGPYGNWSCHTLVICGNVGATRYSNRCISVTGAGWGGRYVTREVCAGQTARDVGIRDVDSFYVGFDEVVIGGPGGLGYVGPRKVYVADTDAASFSVYKKR